MLKDDLKYKNWVFTWNSEDDGSFLSAESLQLLFANYSELDTFCFQLESASRLHYQGMFTLRTRKRFRTVLNDLERLMDTFTRDEKVTNVKNLTIDKMHGTPEHAIAYCTKNDTRVAGPFYSYNIRPYIPHDLAIFKVKDRLYMWQQQVNKNIFGEVYITETSRVTQAHDREITLIVDPQGNSGKSKYVKNLCYNYPDKITKLAFGSAQQLRSAIISAGPRMVYFLDIPRTLGLSDHITDIFSAVEDLKNGFIVSSMYGKYGQLMIEPPHIVIFTNKEINLKLLSEDRWLKYRITPIKKLIKIN